MPFFSSPTGGGREGAIINLRIMKILSAFSKIMLFACVLIMSQQNIMANTNFTIKNPHRIIDTEQPAPFPSNIERLLNNIERYIVTSAEAMPEDKFYFT